MSNSDVRQAVQVDNFRMTAPRDTPLVVARIVYLGWHREPAKRPSFDGQPPPTTTTVTPPLPPPLPTCP